MIPRVRPLRWKTLVLKLKQPQHSTLQVLSDRTADAWYLTKLKVTEKIAIKLCASEAIRSLRSQRLRRSRTASGRMLWWSHVGKASAWISLVGKASDFDMFMCLLQEGDVDEEGIEPKDIELVVSQVNCSRAKAVEALRYLAAEIVRRDQKTKHVRGSVTQVRRQQERHCGGRSSAEMVCQKTPQNSIIWPYFIGASKQMCARPSCNSPPAEKTWEAADRKDKRACCASTFQNLH